MKFLLFSRSYGKIRVLSIKIFDDLGFWTEYELGPMDEGTFMFSQLPDEIELSEIKAAVEKVCRPFSGVTASASICYNLFFKVII